MKKQANGAADIADIAGIAEHATNQAGHAQSLRGGRTVKRLEESKSSELPTVMEFEGSADIGAPCDKGGNDNDPPPSWFDCILEEMARYLLGLASARGAPTSASGSPDRCSAF